MRIALLVMAPLLVAAPAAAGPKDPPAPPPPTPSTTPPPKLAPVPTVPLPKQAVLPPPPAKPPLIGYLSEQVGARNPAIAAGSQNLYVAWESNGDIYVATSADHGITWSVPDNVSSTSTPSRYPVIAAYGAHVTVAWLETLDATHTHAFRTQRANAEPFAAPVDASPDAAGVTHLQLVAASGGDFLGYHERPSTVSGIAEPGRFTVMEGRFVATQVATGDNAALAAGGDTIAVVTEHAVHFSRDAARTWIDEGSAAGRLIGVGHCSKQGIAAAVLDGAVLSYHQCPGTTAVDWEVASILPDGTIERFATNSALPPGGVETVPHFAIGSHAAYMGRVSMVGVRPASVTALFVDTLFAPRLTSRLESRNFSCARADGSDAIIRNSAVSVIGSTPVMVGASDLDGGAVVVGGDADLRGLTTLESSTCVVYRLNPAGTVGTSPVIAGSGANFVVAWLESGRVRFATFLRRLP